MNSRTTCNVYLVWKRRTSADMFFSASSSIATVFLQVSFQESRSADGSSKRIRICRTSSWKGNAFVAMPFDQPVTHCHFSMDLVKNSTQCSWSYDDVFPLGEEKWWESGLLMGNSRIIASFYISRFLKVSVILTN